MSRTASGQRPAPGATFGEGTPRSRGDWSTGPRQRRLGAALWVVKLYITHITRFLLHSGAYSGHYTAARARASTSPVCLDVLWGEDRCQTTTAIASRDLGHDRACLGPRPGSRPAPGPRAGRAGPDRKSVV